MAEEALPVLCLRAEEALSFARQKRNQPQGCLAASPGVRSEGLGSVGQASISFAFRVVHMCCAENPTWLGKSVNDVYAAIGRRGETGGAPGTPSGGPAGPAPIGAPGGGIAGG